jgi:prepilin-type N-terminal cleavage/methylation domain-containing protein
MAFFQRRSRALKASRGFTLIELLVVISILGVLAAVVVLNVVGFIGEGKTEAKAVELKQVHTAAGAYLFEGMPLASATDVGPPPVGKKVLDPYLLGDLKYSWIIDTDGSVYPRVSPSTLNSLDGFTSLPGGGISWAGDLSSSGTPSILLATGVSLGDFTFETTATLTSGDGYGMYYLSDSNANNGYIVQFNPASGFTVSTVINGTISAPLSPAVMPSGFAVNGQHSISVSVSGGSHSIQVDGATVITLTGQSIGSGTVGLQSSAGSNVNFTGFTVSPP